MKDQDKIMYYKNMYNITNFTTYEDLRRSIYNYELSNFVDLVYRGNINLPMSTVCIWYPFNIGGKINIYHIYNGESMGRVCQTIC